MGLVSLMTKEVTMDDIRTVTVNRVRNSQVEDITVAFKMGEGDWEITDVLSEDGEELTLNANEELMARCLVKAGVDETGR